MNDGDHLPLPPEQPDVDAVLDGEATPEQRARVAADPELARALAARTWVRDELAAVPPLPPDVAERALAAALEAADARQAYLAADREAEERRAVLPLRRRWGGILAPAAGWIGAAAVVIALVVGGARVLGSGDGGGDSTASAPTARPEQLAASATTGGAGSAAPPERSTAAGGPPAEADDAARSGAGTTLAAGAGPTTPLALPAVDDLGAFDDPDALRRALEAAGLTRDAPVATALAPAACPAPDGGEEGATSSAVATLTYDGVAATAWVRWRADGSAGELVVVSVDGCRVLVTVPLS